MLSHLQDRISLIFNVLDQYSVSVAPVSVNFDSFKLKVILADGSSLRINEQYRNDTLEKYAYYWLDQRHELLIGWDNAPHHPQLSTHPHHKHVASQSNIQPASESSLDDVLKAILQYLLQSSM
ncbi:MAG TPA: hypothetical protein G4N96_08480 [Chloroflexi bacterium]|nr:MAG: hypothetical protein B6243_13840 [Anaerolineaceae bacterium 4572_5.2]HEY85129.1 hypothetical protein [Chloroflexota bacterium]